MPALLKHTKTTIKKIKKIIPPKGFTIIVDTREQLPYTFSTFNVPVIRHTLKTGDYSVKGMESFVSIERKSKEDFYSSVSTGRTRFKKCVERLSQLRRAMVVIECSFEDLLTPPAYSDMNPASVIGTAQAWEIDFQVPFHYINNRYLAEIYVYRALEKFFLRKEKILLQE